MQGTSIQKRLMRVMLITCGATLLFTLIAYFGYQYYHFRGSYITQLSNTGKIIAANSTAALAFADQDAANEILSSLKADPHIEGACLYDKGGKIFAKYPAYSPDSIFPEVIGEQGYDMGASHFAGFEPVMQEDKLLGTLYLRTDMAALYELLALYTFIAFLVLGIAFLFAFILSKRLQRRISGPILSLAETSKAISQHGDYSVRATKNTDDELGLLTDAFNLMLSRIEAQNQEIIWFNQRLEQKVSERTAQLEMANKELESFSYSVSHDLRSPLRAVLGYSNILQQDYSQVLDEDARDMLKSIQGNAQRMGTLIDDLLSFSRLGRKEIKKVVVDMQQQVNDVLREINQIPGNTANIVIGDLPPALADSALMHQVWMNLISNGIKYSSKKDNPEVEIGSFMDAGQIIYYVKDNGAGFDMNYVNKLFNVFQRLHSADEFEGTGIGLAIVSKIIIKHGGRVWAEGSVNHGATFYFTLPIQ